MHAKEIGQYEEARGYFMRQEAGEPFPDMKALKAEKARLTRQMALTKDALRPASRERKALRVAQANVEEILGLANRERVEGDRLAH